MVTFIDGVDELGEEFGLLVEELCWVLGLLDEDRDTLLKDFM